MLIKPKEPTPHFREAEKMNELLLTEELAFARFGGVTLFSFYRLFENKKDIYKFEFDWEYKSEESVTSVLHCTRYLFFF